MMMRYTAICAGVFVGIFALQSMSEEEIQKLSPTRRPIVQKPLGIGLQGAYHRRAVLLDHFRDHIHICDHKRIAFA